MTDEEIKELRNDLVMLSAAINQIEDRMRKGLFTNALAIVEEQKDIVNKYNPLYQPNETEYIFPSVGFLCMMCSSRLTLVGSDKDCLTFECNHCPFEGRISISHSEYKEVNFTNVKL